MNSDITKNNTRKISSDIIFLVLSIFGGLIAGVVFGLIGSFIYLVIVFPIAMGATGSYIIIENTKFTKTRNITLLIISSLLITLVLYGASHYMRYLGLQVMTAFQAFGDFSDKSLEAAKVVVEYALEKETGQTGFVGYMLLQAKEGTSIGRVFRSSRMNLGPVFTWLYWLIEIAIIAFITVSTGKKIAKKPFCQICDSWYPPQKHLGGTSADKEIEILNLITQRDFLTIGKAIEENPDPPSLELYLQSCNSCDKSESILTVSKTKFVNGKLASKEILKTTLTPREKKLLVDEIEFFGK